MADEQNTQEKSGQDKPANPQKSPLIIVLLLVNILCLGFVAFQQYKFMELEAKRPDLTQILAEGEAANNPEVVDEARPTETLKKENLVDLESFTVNLAQGDGPRRYVRLNTVLKMSDDSDLTEIQSRKPQIRDTIISILNAKRPEDLLKRDGKLYLKEQIKSSINSYLIEGKVEDLFYVGFQIN
ncbi:MAG: flagellar basal body-associated FliL family protein [Bacteriovoracaceae bacterium]|jgi:flagellar FliL protein|nr:flagellar basal body-associated FliL family protein [Bacteriovoracaceae bacterium]